MHINGMTVRTTICRADVEYQSPSSLWNNNGIIGFGFVRNDSNRGCGDAHDECMC